MHCNKGNSNFLTKYDDIAQILDFFKPHLLSVQEVNYNVECDVKFRGYNLEYNLLTKTYQTARTVLSIREDIPYERCNNTCRNQHLQCTISIFAYLYYVNTFYNLNSMKFMNCS